MSYGGGVRPTGDHAGIAGGLPAELHRALGPSPPALAFGPDPRPASSKRLRPASLEGLSSFHHDSCRGHMGARRRCAKSLRRASSVACARRAQPLAKRGAVPLGANAWPCDKKWWESTDVGEHLECAVIAK